MLESLNINCNLTSKNKENAKRANKKGGLRQLRKIV